MAETRNTSHPEPNPQQIRVCCLVICLFIALMIWLITSIRGDIQTFNASRLAYGSKISEEVTQLKASMAADRKEKDGLEARIRKNVAVIKASGADLDKLHKKFTQAIQASTTHTMDAAKNDAIAGALETVDVTGRLSKKKVKEYRQTAEKHRQVAEKNVKKFVSGADQLVSARVENLKLTQDVAEAEQRLRELNSRDAALAEKLRDMRNLEGIWHGMGLLQLAVNRNGLDDRAGRAKFDTFGDALHLYLAIGDIILLGYAGIMLLGLIVRLQLFRYAINPLILVVDGDS